MLKFGLLISPIWNLILFCTVPQPSEASIAGPSLVIVSIISCLPGAFYLPPSQSLMAASSSYFTVRGWAGWWLGTQLLAIHQLTTSSPAEFDPVQVAPCLCGGRRRTICNKFAHFGESKHLKHNTAVDTCSAGRGQKITWFTVPHFAKIIKQSSIYWSQALKKST